MESCHHYLYYHYVYYYCTVKKALQVQGAQPLFNCFALLWYDDVIESFNIFTSNDVESYTKF